MDLRLAPYGGTQKNVDLDVKIAEKAWEIATAMMAEAMDSYTEESEDFQKFQIVPAIASLTITRLFVDSMAAASPGNTREDVSEAWIEDFLDYMESTVSTFQIQKAMATAAYEKKYGNE